MLGFRDQRIVWKGSEEVAPPKKGTVRVQVPNTHILAKNLYYKHQNPKYSILGYTDC